MTAWRIVCRPELEGLFPADIYPSYGAANQDRTVVARRHGYAEWLEMTDCYGYRTRTQAKQASIHHNLGTAGRIF